MLRRTGFKKPEYIRPPPSAPSRITRGVQSMVTDEVRAAPKDEKAKPGKGAATSEERKWMDDIVSYGCIACRIDGHASRPAAVHHILRGGQRIGHLFTLPLCDPGHHQGGQEFGLVSRHPWKARFEEKYGAELEILDRLRQELGRAKDGSLQ